MLVAQYETAICGRRVIEILSPLNNISNIRLWILSKQKALPKRQKPRTKIVRGF
jgi:hypothetical protein